MKGRRETRTATAEQPSGAAHGITESPYLTAAECAEYLRFKNLPTFYEWLQTGAGRSLPKLRRGTRMLLFDRRVVDAFLRGELSPKQSVTRRVIRHAPECAEEQR